jgi:outer membrane protein
VNENNLYYLKGVPSGEYALIVYLDENNNERIDKNFIGIPKEPIGFSNRYQPKGPPVFSSAAFRISENEVRDFQVTLELPLGKLGRLGAGLGVIARSSPYRDYNGSVTQAIPAITYRGERLQILGPTIQLGLVGSGKLRLAASGRYRIGVYDEEDSDFLIGMEDRKDTFTAGLSLEGELPGGIDVSARYEHDVLDEIGGSEARLGIDKSFQFGAFRISPEIAVNWLSADFANYDFGVPVSDSLPNRPSYQLDSTVSFETGFGMFYEITRDWLVVANIGVEFLDDQVIDSPIVEEDYVLKGFFALNYVF